MPVRASVHSEWVSESRPTRLVATDCPVIPEGGAALPHVPGQTLGFGIKAIIW